jgi:hypothetical protein
MLTSSRNESPARKPCSSTPTKAPAISQRIIEDSPLSRSPDGSSRFPTLPIINPAVSSPRTERAKYGGLFYLGIGGLVLLIVLIAWFGHGLWANGQAFADVYVLHDSSRGLSKRAEAAFRLAHSGRLDDGQLMEMSLNRDLPDLVRYLLAEGVSAQAAARDPRGYSLAVARSPDWPDWLRLLLVRPLAYGSGRGYAIPREVLVELAGHHDPVIGLWASYALAARPVDHSNQRAVLEKTALAKDANGELAAQLLRALDADEPERSALLDRTTIWLRHHHPASAEIWKGREADEPGLAQGAAE